MRFDASLTKDNHSKICALMDAAFPTDFESMFVSKLRADEALAAEHGLWDSDTLVGYIAYSTVQIENLATAQVIMGLGPMAISPKLQGRGIGLELLKTSIVTIKADAIILLGHVGFYDKAGFEPAAKFNLYFQDKAENINAFMAYEVKANSLRDIKGRVIYHPAFYQG